MRTVSFCLLALAGMILANCDTEAGASDSFPPIGGSQQPTYTPLPQTFNPSEAAAIEAAQNQAMTDAELTASLSNAVNAALAESGAERVNANVETVDPQIDPVTGEAITSDDGVLNLSLQSQEEQRIAREADAAAITAAAAQRVVIAPGEMPEVIAGVNIIAYARSSTNNVGQRIVRRPAIRRTNSRAQCAKFDTTDNAQRNFLANGGPQEDPLNLDPDGDGFACRWSPESYRALDLN